MLSHVTGHVFVVHGDLLKIAADAVLVPCDLIADVSPHWGRFCLTSDEAPDVAGELENGHVSGFRAQHRQLYRYVDTGATSSTADAKWLASRFRAGLDAILDDLARANRPAEWNRARHLVAMPLFGVGAGGFADIRGGTLRAILRSAQAAVAGRDADVVIVCWQRSDFAALQSQRVEADWSTLDAVLRQHAGDLASEARAGRLVLSSERA